MNLTDNFLIPAVFFLLTLAFGFRLSRSGKPYGAILFNIHKLIALGAVILYGIPIFQMLKNTEATFSVMALIVFTGVCLLSLFAFGALLSLKKPAAKIFQVIHRVAPFLGLLSMVATVYLLVSGNMLSGQ